MRFEIVRESDRQAGRVGVDVRDAPATGATFNATESRWELEVSDLEAMLAINGGIYWLSVLPMDHEEGELPLIEVMDVEDDEDEPQEPN